MSDTATEEENEAPETDEVREGIVAALSEHLGDAIVETHIAPGLDLWVRVRADRWVEVHDTARDILGYRFFDYLSVIDWLPSPFGRDMESEPDWAVHGREEKELPDMVSGYAGGDTRFQLISRLMNITTNIGIHFKADLADQPVVDTLIPVFPGANWHEREAWEMYGVTFTGHPDLRALYLPSGFEGNPMRKDFPLLARRVKPWPGIVDVEGMPGDGDDAEDGGAA